MQIIIILTLLTCSALYLFYIKEEGIERLSPAMQWGVAVSKHVVALFTAVFGSNAIGILILLPLFLYHRQTQSQAALDLISDLIDRPYFPLQTLVAFLLGLICFRWFREGWVKFVWVLPAVQGVVAVTVFITVFNPTHWDDYWSVFFNWGCGCSASPPQWTVMLPLYTSVAFAMGAAIRDALTHSGVPGNDPSELELRTRGMRNSE